VRRFQPLHDLSAAQLRAEVSGQCSRDLYQGRGEKFQWIIELGPEPVGWVTLVVSNWEHGLAEVGYALTTARQKQGLFRRTRLERIEARCAVDNEASQRVLETIGFLREGRLRSYFRLHGRRVDNYLYSMLKEDWLAP